MRETTISYNLIERIDEPISGIPDEIMKLVDRVIKQAEEINISMNFYQNHPFEHQKSNTECGMFSLYLIITLLRDCKGFKEFMNKRVPDAKMKKLRN